MSCILQYALFSRTLFTKFLLSLAFDLLHSSTTQPIVSRFLSCQSGLHYKNAYYQGTSLLNSPRVRRRSGNIALGLAIPF